MGFKMREILDLFSLTTYGDAPVGLKVYKQNNKLNQPTLEEQKQFKFTPLFNSSPQFAFQYDSEEETDDEDYDLSWFSYPGHKNV